MKLSKVNTSVSKWPFFTPSEIQKEESYPDVVLSGLKILDRKISIGQRINGRVLLPDNLNQIDQLVIKEKENDLSFDFLTIHTATPLKTNCSTDSRGIKKTGLV